MRDRSLSLDTRCNRRYAGGVNKGDSLSERLVHAPDAVVAVCDRPCRTEHHRLEADFSGRKLIPTWIQFCPRIGFPADCPRFSRQYNNRAMIRSVSGPHTRTARNQSSVHCARRSSPLILYTLGRFQRPRAPTETPLVTRCESFDGVQLQRRD